MILNTLVLFALALTGPVNTNSGGYSYSENLSYTQQSKSMYQVANGGTDYIIDTSITLTCINQFDDSESWRISDIRIEVNSYAYFIDGNQAVLDSSCSYVISYDWVFNPSQYSQEFDYLKFVTGINDDDYLYISYYDHDVLQSTSLSDELDSSFDEVALSKNNITFDDVSFFTSIENLMSNFITETETVVIVQPSEVSTASIIFQGICNIGLMPVNFFLGVLNFEVFGINIGAFVSALLTLAIVIIIVRIIFAGGNGKGKE